MFIKNKKLVFDPPLTFERLEKVSDTYEIPDWVEEEDKMSRKKKKSKKNKSIKNNVTAKKEDETTSKASDDENHSPAEVYYD